MQDCPLSIFKQNSPLLFSLPPLNKFASAQFDTPIMSTYFLLYIPIPSRSQVYQKKVKKMPRNIISLFLATAFFFSFAAIIVTTLPVSTPNDDFSGLGEWQKLHHGQAPPSLFGAPAPTPSQAMCPNPDCVAGDSLCSDPLVPST